MAFGAGAIPWRGRASVSLALFACVGVTTVMNCTPARSPGGSVRELRTLELRDESRSRDVPVHVYFPAKKGLRCPVVVFSHGLGGSKDGYAYLARYWAAHGYVVIAPTHRGSDRSMLQRGRWLQNLQAVREMMKDERNLVRRPKDVSFVLDSLEQVAAHLPAHIMDETRIGLGGHSFGAYTTLAVSGAKVRISGRAIEGLADPRVKAFVAMSPQGTDRPFFGDGAFAHVHGPFFVLTGTRDAEIGGGPPSRRLDAYREMPAGGRYLAVIRGANHMDFAETQLDGEVRDPRVHRWIQEATTLFWNATLKGDRAAIARLRKGDWPAVEGVSVHTEQR